MSGLEPPVPAAAADAFTADGATSERPASSAGTVSRSKEWQRWRRLVGLLLLALTVFLWTASNFLASTIFADDTYSKPYFVTYVNTSFFIVPLVPILLRKAYLYPEDLRQWRNEWKEHLRGRYVLLKGDGGPEGSIYTDSPRSRHRRPSINASEELLLGESIDGGEMLGSKSTIVSEPTVEGKLSLPETARLSLEFCIIWFLANYCVAACLEYTTVASSTILTSTSSVFTLIFGAIFGVERFTVRKLLGVLASLAGIILISTIDLSGHNTDDEHRGDFPSKSLREIAIGDALALLSALMYGIYAVFMKKRIGDESRVDMPLFFGLVGFINVLLLWPGLVILHVTGLERFELPPSTFVTIIILCNSSASLVSDLAWAYAVLLTSPIVVTVGLSVTIPLSMIGQNVLHGQTSGPLYWLGALIVVSSFFFVNQEEEKEDVVRLPDHEGQHEREDGVGV